MRSPPPDIQHRPLAPLAVRLPDFIKALRAARGTKAIARVVKATMDGLRTDYQPTTLPYYLHQHRQAVAKRFGVTHPAFGMLLSHAAGARAGVPAPLRMGFTVEETKQAKLGARRRVVGYQRNQTPVTLQEGRSLIATASALIINPGIYTKGPQKGQEHWEKILVGLCLLAGRRPVETALLGTFTKPKPSRAKESWIEFTGQAKTRGAHGTRQDAYLIPLLAPAGFVYKAWLRLHRNLPKFTSPTHFNSVASVRMSAVMTLMDQCLHRHLTAYDLRAIYARLTYHAFAPDGQADVAWFSDVLGHKLLVEEHGGRSAERADTLTAAYYQKFYIPDVPAPSKTSRAKTIKSLHS